MYKKTGNLRAAQLLLGHTKLDPSADITLVPDEWHPHMPDRLNEDELADCPC